MRKHGSGNDMRPPNARTLYSFLCRHESRFFLVFFSPASRSAFGYDHVRPLAGARALFLRFICLSTAVSGLRRRRGFGLDTVRLAGVSTFLLLDSWLAKASQLFAQAAEQHVWVLGLGLGGYSGLV